MNNRIISPIIKDIEETNKEVRSEQSNEYTIVNVRPSENILAMLDFMSKLSRKNYSSVIPEIISLELANFATSIEYAETILDTAEKIFSNGDNCFQEGCALAILGDNDYIKYELSPTEREVKIKAEIDKLFR